MHDLLVIGGGPAGASAAAWAARRGLDVLVVERGSSPRDKACGDVLTPQAVHHLDELGLGGVLNRFHRVDGIRFCGYRRQVDIAWPETECRPPHGYVARRAGLDALVLEHAAHLGATVWSPAEAVAPLLHNGLLIGATVRFGASASTEEVAARYVIIADGANSRFARALGVSRDRSVPVGVATRTYFTSPRADETWLESTLDIRDPSGATLPGFGWVFPVGDGTVNVGVGLLSARRNRTSVDTTHLLGAHAARLVDRWQLDPAAPLGPPAGGRLPMGGSVGPAAGPNWLVAGDAAAAIRPLSGAGVAAAYESGRLAAGLVAEALGTADGLVLRRYPTELSRRVAHSLRTARLFARAVGNPSVARELPWMAMRSRAALERAVRTMIGE